MAGAKYVDALPSGQDAKGGYSPMTTVQLYIAPPEQRVFRRVCAGSLS